MDPYNDYSYNRDRYKQEKNDYEKRINELQTELNILKKANL